MNENYAAVVVEIGNVYPLAKCDNVAGTMVYGYQAIVSKTTKPGDVMIFFPPECQLSHEYCRDNNLYRDKDQNKDSKAVGYFDLNRRVRAIKFRGHTSNCLLMPSTSLKNAPAVGTVFDKHEGVEICRKYEPYRKASRGPTQAQPKAPRIDRLFFPEHFDTSQYHRSAHLIAPYEDVIVTQKLHGTSVRIANTKVPRQLTLLERVAKFFGANIAETEYKFVYGSRRVTKNDDSPGYYGEDIWGRHARRLDGKIPRGFVVYGEIVGWISPTQAIQKGYTYHLPPGESELYVYRVSFLNDAGQQYDLSHDQIVQFCMERDLKVVPRLYAAKHEHLDAVDFLDRRYASAVSEALSLSDPKSVDEGVCIRAENPLRILKLKSPLFLEYETKQLDAEVVDVESGAA